MQKIEISISLSNPRIAVMIVTRIRVSIMAKTRLAHFSHGISGVDGLSWEISGGMLGGVVSEGQ